MTKCVICLEDVNSSFRIDGHEVCHSDLCRLFERAINDQSDYPPKLGSRILQPDHYRRHLPQALIDAFHAKEREYMIPVDDCIYCSDCSQSVTERLDEVDQVHRRGCLQMFCCACGDKWYGWVREGLRHVCSSGHQAGSNDDGVAFAGLTRGKDYQICPSKICKRKIQLSEGCNRIICTCGQEFCFICGQPAAGHSDHWSRLPAGCPRWNHPRAANALYDYDDFHPRAALAPPPKEPQYRERRNAVAGVHPGEIPPRATFRGLPYCHGTRDYSHYTANRAVIDPRDYTANRAANDPRVWQRLGQQQQQAAVNRAREAFALPPPGAPIRCPPPPPPPPRVLRRSVENLPGRGTDVLARPQSFTADQGAPPRARLTSDHRASQEPRGPRGEGTFSSSRMMAGYEATQNRNPRTLSPPRSARERAAERPHNPTAAERYATPHPRVLDAMEVDGEGLVM
ncbi:uncharacterized protein LTR77_010916 [Saxophila tyrrhenica]|uniref:IBR domain-containing protein n=1 Tax=Saxophila tyrrhenica TaxID=1690608 RepID=A0AAV9NXF9_9PEZI|nr:hypothetical protein LTR77_010916 [Saxophila tyrrhenica]